MGEEVETEVLSVRVTKPLARLVEEYLHLDAHVSKSDFVRDAIREKIKRDVPWLYNKIFNLREDSRDEKG